LTDSDLRKILVRIAFKLQFRQAEATKIIRDWTDKILNLNKWVRFSALILPILMVALLIFSCAKEKVEIVQQDNLTDDKPIASVAMIDEENITEGNKFFLQGDFKNAIKYYEEGLKGHRSVAFYNIGVSYYLLDDIEKSEEYFRKTIAEDAGFKEAYVNLAVVLIQQGKLEEAEKFVSQLLKDEKSAKLLVNLANIHLKRGETLKASDIYEEAVKKDNKSKFVMSSYAYFLLTIGELTKGIEIIENLEYKNFTDYYNLGRAYYLKNMYKKAVENLNRAFAFKRTEELLDLLALNYEKLRQFKREIDTLNLLVIKWPKDKYKFRLATALFRYRNLNLAERRIMELLEAKPNEPDYVKLYYKILIELGEYKKAGARVLKSYNENGETELLYLYIKHKIVYENSPQEVKTYIDSDSNDPYLNLARAVYYIKNNKMLPASNALGEVPVGFHEDYYTINAFLLMKYRKYDKALEVTEKMNDISPEYFWYKTANLINTKNIKGLRTHLQKHLEIGIKFQRRPEFSFHMKPVVDDLHFSYKFDGNHEQIMAAFMYPLFIEPDEMLTFLTLGYKLLKQNDKVVALKELEKSIKFSNGIKANNEGVKAFLRKDFKEAENHFENGNQMLSNNPYTLYNLGLVYLNMGYFDKAKKYFSDAVIQNRYLYPAYLGIAACEKELGNERNMISNYSYVTDSSYRVEEIKDKVPPIIYSMKFLADLGMRNYADVVEQINAIKNKDGFLKGILALAKYYQTRDEFFLEEMVDSGIFRGDVIRSLIKKLNGAEEKPDMNLAKDRYYKYMSAYLEFREGKSKSEFVFDENTKDSVLLKELFYYNILMNKPRKAFRFLQRLNGNSITYPELYKASLYYFVWLEDFINAEASFTSLDSLGYSDKFVLYYKLLYFITNYNSDRIVKILDQYKKKYPGEFRGEAIKGFNALKEDDIKMAEELFSKVAESEGNFFLKMPLEIEIDGL